MDMEKVVLDVVTVGRDVLDLIKMGSSGEVVDIPAVPRVNKVGNKLSSHL